jgi:hypothetical protein
VKQVTLGQIGLDTLLLAPAIKPLAQPIYSTTDGAKLGRCNRCRHIDP